MNTIRHACSTSGPFCQRQELNKQHGGDLYKLFGFYVITVGAKCHWIYSAISPGSERSHKDINLLDGRPSESSWRSVAPLDTVKLEKNKHKLQKSFFGWWKILLKWRIRHYQYALRNIFYTHCICSVDETLDLCLLLCLFCDFMLIILFTFL